MNTVFFAVRRPHLRYFSRIAARLNPNDTASQVVWHKSLVFKHFWLRAVFAAQPDLSDTLRDHIKEKQNSAKGQKRSAFYWRTLLYFKSLEAKLLYAIYYQALKSRNAKTVVLWNGLKFRQRIAMAAAAELGMRTFVMENGLLPGMTTLDPQGVNYVNSVPRDPAFFLPYADQYDWLPPEPPVNPPQDVPKDYIFVPFQVNTDSQIVLFSDWIKDMSALTEVFLKAEQSLGDAMPHIVMKTHPACGQDYTQLAKALQQESQRITLLNTGDTQSLISHAKAVITINSTVGIEAITRNIRTLVLGQAFYNLPGLTLSARDQTQLEAALTELPEFNPDPVLRLGFLNYLKHEYQVPGRWQDASDTHCAAAAERIRDLLNAHG